MICRRSQSPGETHRSASSQRPLLVPPLPTPVLWSLNLLWGRLAASGLETSRWVSSTWPPSDCYPPRLQGTTPFSQSPSCPPQTLALSFPLHVPAWVGFWPDQRSGFPPRWSAYHPPPHARLCLVTRAATSQRDLPLDVPTVTAASQCHCPPSLWPGEPSGGVGTLRVGQAG